MRCQSVSSARARSGMTGGDGGLQRVGTRARAEFSGAIERGQAAVDQKLIPQRAILIQKQDGLSQTDRRGRWSATPESP